MVVWSSNWKNNNNCFEQQQTIEKINYNNNDYNLISIINSSLHRLINKG